MSGTDDPTHVYWDLENRKGLWAKGEGMGVPTAKEIIRGIRHADEDWDAASSGQVLAERVEAVLEACKIPGGDVEAWDFARRVEHILDGGKP